MIHSTVRHQTIASSILLLLAIGTAMIWVSKGREHHYPDAPNGQFNCLSYTPRSRSDHPTEADTRNQIAIDMRQLSARTRCVRTYSVMNGLDEVPIVARKLGMKVLLGIWIGRGDDANELEIRHAIEIANANRDVIEAIIVGNEVLLRREQEAPALSAMMQRVHDATQLPVTYADVWDFWLKNPSMAEHASFVTIHILPYWDDIPISIEHAMEHVDQIYKKIQNKFPGKPIYVGETGWPSAGRQREAAAPSLVNEARFTREFIEFANAHALPNNFIEAYDQPWKKAQEGTVGGYWGLYDVDGNEKFPLTGVVVEDAQWWHGLATGSATAAFIVLIAWLKRQRSTLLLTTYALAGFILGTALLLQWHYWLISNRNWQEWACALVWGVACNIVFVGALVPRSTYGKWGSLLLTGAEAVLLFGLSYINLGLVFDARYRDFPTMFLLLPTVALVINRLINCPDESIRSNIHPLYRSVFCCWMLISSVVIAWIEKLTNVQAISWCICCLLLAWAILPRLRSLRASHAQAQI